MTLDWGKLLPVIVSILIIIAIAIVRNYSRTLAAIISTMPINVPLGLWVVSAADSSPEAMADFTRGMLIGIFPTVGFIAAAWLAFKAGLGLVPAILIGYLVWGVGLGLTLLVRALI